MTTGTADTPRLTPEHSEGIEAAPEALADAGFSEQAAERIVATILAELGRPS